MSFCISDIIYSRRSVKIPSISYKWYFLFKFRSMTDLLLSSKWGHGNKTPKGNDGKRQQNEGFSGEIFLASSSPFLPPFFAQIGSLRALAGWRSLISCRDGWLLLLFKDSAWLRERLSKKPFPKFIIDIQKSSISKKRWVRCRLLNQNYLIHGSW